MISVIIPTRDRQTVLTRTLSLLCAQNLPATEYELIIVDDGSQGDTTSVVMQAAQTSEVSMRLLRQPQTSGPAVARNRGIREARGEVVLFIGDDLWAKPGLLSTHARFHQDHPELQAALLACVIQSPELPKDPFNLWFRPFAFHMLDGKREADWRFFWTNNLSVKHAFLLEYGLFDEEFPSAAHEDAELGYRLATYGLRLFYESHPLGEHYHPRTLREACQSQWQHGATFVIFERKVPESGLREQYGIFSWRNRPAAILRFGLRNLVFNRLSVPLLVRWMEQVQHPALWLNWLYWKVLMHYMQRGYAESPYRLKIS